jgi:hypothetical protein
MPRTPRSAVAAYQARCLGALPSSTAVYVTFPNAGRVRRNVLVCWEGLEMTGKMEPFGAFGAFGAFVTASGVGNKREMQE